MPTLESHNGRGGEVAGLDPAGVACTPKLDTIFQVPGVMQACCRAGGVIASCRLATSSLLLSKEIGPHLQELASYLQPRLFVFGGHGGRGIAAHASWERVDVVDPAARQVCEQTPMPIARCASAAVAISGLLYVFGGRDGGPHDEALASVHRLDPNCGAWEELPSMPTARKSCVAAAIQRKACVAGGYGGLLPLSSADRFDPYGNVWTSLASLNQSRGDCAAASLNDVLFVVGGLDDGYRSLSTAECLDLSTNAGCPTWRMLPSMSAPRASCAAAALAGALFVIGGVSDGWGSLDTVERFSIASQQWEQMPSMDRPRRDFAAVAAAGTIYVIGGTSHGCRSTSIIERFNPNAGEWEDLVSLPPARSRCAAAAAWC